MKRILFLLLFFVITFSLFSQITVKDYQRADSISRFKDLVYNQILSVNAIDSTHVFWYYIRTPDGFRYYLADADKQVKRAAFDHFKLSEAIKREIKVKSLACRLTLKNLKFASDTLCIYFEKKDTLWSCDLRDYSIKSISEISNEPKPEHWGETTQELDLEPVLSPDGKRIAFIKDYNLFVRDIKGKNVKQLSFDGSAGDLYSSYILWSPNSRYITTNKIRLHEKRYIHFIESAPSEQLQPKLHKLEYLKPGDALPIIRPALFNVDENKQINVDTHAFENQYSISNVKWWNDSRGFTFEFNERGHQAYQVVDVNAQTGVIKTLIDERSSTFIDYSGKHYRFDTNDGTEIIWASERNGWNHLYLFDAITGKIKNQITKGEWVVRGVDYVDEQERSIIFHASGRNKSEDPYNIHYYKISFSGQGMVELTPEEMNHQACFSSDYKYFINTYSLPDTPPVSIIRSSINGQSLLLLEEADIYELKAKGWIAPEVFTAKARDGKTDIWGNIYRPVNFNPEKSYPIIEYIYAGPQSSFVQKDFAAYMGAFSSLAELGFIIVQIDGMGTSNRSKAFQDVCFRNIKDAGFPDRIKWIKAAAAKYPYMDTTRVGIFGASAGGQNAMGALLFHHDFYKAGVASCGCHDNRMDKMWWNEQWMGYPVGPHYAESSNVENAHLLKGDLMLIVGEVDDNVDPASTMQVADALIKAGKDFELVVLPGVSHTLGGLYGERKRRDFFVKSLLNMETPKWNE